MSLPGSHVDVPGDHPDAPPVLTTARLELVPATPAVLRALLAGDVEQAEALLRCRISPAWVERAAAYLQLRLDDLDANPGWQTWLDRFLLRRSEDRPLAGHVGFHGPPDARGVLEVGYRVLEEHRGAGLATEAVAALLDWACRAQGVCRFRASIAPGNAASLRIAGKLGFVETGRQIDEHDGEEVVFEVDWPPA